MSQLRVVPCLQGKAPRGRNDLRVFVAGATGALGRHLVPGLVAAGHQVTATTRTPGKVAQVRQAGAEPVAVDGLDREAVTAAVWAAGPEVIVHQMTALAGVRSLRKPDQVGAATNQLRTRGTDNLLAAAARVGTRRVIVQSNDRAYERSGGPVKTESAAGPGSGRSSRSPTPRPRRWRRSAAARLASTTWWTATRRRWRSGCRTWPRSRGAKPPLRVPAWLGRLLAGELVVAQMTSWRGSSNEKARKALGWEPRYPSWREGFGAWVSR
jgi:NAD(P)H-binding